MYEIIPYDLSSFNKTHSVNCSHCQFYDAMFFTIGVCLWACKHLPDLPHLPLITSTHYGCVNFKENCSHNENNF